MSLAFSNFKKKIYKKKYLELNFYLEDNSSMAIIDKNKKNLDLIVNVLSKKEKYDGVVLFNDENIKKTNYYPFFEKNIGFYKNFSVYSNIKLLLSLYNIKIDKNTLVNYLIDIGVSSKDKYDKLKDNNKIKLKLLFSYLVSNNLLIFNIENYKNNKEVLLYINNLIDLAINNKKTLLLLSSECNFLTDKVKNALVIFNNRQIYFNNMEKLKTINNLIVIKIEDYVKEDLYKNINIDFKLVENDIIVEKNNMEDILYYFIKNDIKVISINDLIEDIELYLDKE